MMDNEFIRNFGTYPRFRAEVNSNAVRVIDEWQYSDKYNTDPLAVMSFPHGCNGVVSPYAALAAAERFANARNRQEGTTVLHSPHMHHYGQSLLP